MVCARVSIGGAPPPMPEGCSAVSPGTSAAAAATAGARRCAVVSAGEVGAAPGADVADVSEGGVVLERASATVLASRSKRAAYSRRKGIPRITIGPWSWVCTSIERKSGAHTTCWPSSRRCTGSVSVSGARRA